MNSVSSSGFLIQLDLQNTFQYVSIRTASRVLLCWLYFMLDLKFNNNYEVTVLTFRLDRGHVMLISRSKPLVWGST